MLSSNCKGYICQLNKHIFAVKLLSQQGKETHAHTERHLEIGYLLNNIQKVDICLVEMAMRSLYSSSYPNRYSSFRYYSANKQFLVDTQHTLASSSSLLWKTAIDDKNGMRFLWAQFYNNYGNKSQANGWRFPSYCLVFIWINRNFVVCTVSVLAGCDIRRFKYSTQLWFRINFTMVVNRCELISSRHKTLQFSFQKC